jgi:hypothetical protein
MADGKIYEAQVAIQTYLESKLQDIRRIDLFEGVFDDDELKRFITAPDSLRLSFLGAANIDRMPGGELVLMASFGIYSVTVGGSKTRDAINRMEACVALLSGAGIGEDEGFGVPYTMPVVIGEIQNLYTKDAGVRGVAIYAMSFVVPILVGQAVFANDLANYDPTTWQLSGYDGSQLELLYPTETET